MQHKHKPIYIEILDNKTGIKCFSRMVISLINPGAKLQLNDDLPTY